MQLRPYQSKLQLDIRAALRRHRSTLAVSPTGSGKTVTFCDIARQALATNNRCYIVAHREELIRQISGTLGRWRVDHGFVSSKRSMSIIDKVQVCSVGTLVNRLDKLPPPALLIMDEAHHCTAGTWRKVIDHWGSSKVIGFTATPERLDGSPLGDVFESMVMGPSVQSLIDASQLVTPRYHLLPSSLAEASVRRSGGDYNQRELEEATMAAVGMDGRSIFGDAVKHYSQRIPGMPAIVFTPSIRIVERVANDFCAAGWRFAVLHGGNRDDERTDRVNGLASGKYHGLVTVDLVSEGFDVPVCAAAIMLRKTASLGLFLQQGGRALRPAPGKRLAHIFDHVGNVNMHGTLEQDRVWSLGERVDRRKERTEEKGIQTRQCPMCFVAHEPAPMCPCCGHVYTARDRDIRIVSGELIEMEAGTGQPISDAWRKCGCGHIHRRDRKCAACGHDHAAEERRKKNKDEASCETLADLIELGKRRGYKNPAWWAQNRWRTSRKFASKREAAQQAFL